MGRGSQNRTTRVSLDHTAGSEDIAIPLIIVYQTSRSPCRRISRFFEKRMARRRLLNNVLNTFTNGSIFPFINKPILAKQPLILSSYKDQIKDLALASCIHFPVKAHNRVSRKIQVSWVLQSPVSSSKVSSEMEGNHRPKQATHFLECREILNRNTRVHKCHCKSREWVSSRPPSHSLPPKLKKVPSVSS